MSTLFGPGIVKSDGFLFIAQKIFSEFMHFDEE